MTTAAIKRESVPIWMLVVGAVLIWCVFGGVLAYQKLQSDKPEREWADTKAQLLADAHLVVGTKLKDPASAIFSDERVLGTGPDQRVCGQVNAKNSYGGYAGSERYLVIAGSAYLGDDRPPQVIWPRPEHPCDVF